MKKDFGVYLPNTYIKGKQIIRQSRPNILCKTKINVEIYRIL